MFITGVVSRDVSFTADVTAALTRLSEHLAGSDEGPSTGLDPLLVEDAALCRASRFIKNVMQEEPAALRTVSAPSISALKGQLSTLDEPGLVLLTVVHTSAIIRDGEEDGEDLETQLRLLRAPENGPATFGTSAGAIRVYSDRHPSSAPHALRPYELFQRPADPSVLRAQVIAAFTEQFQFQSGGDRKGTARPGTKLASAVQLLMDDVAPSGWDLRYYTGSIVSSLINALEDIVEKRGQYPYRGPNEHSLAAGALARWMLDDVPSVIVVTSAMLDEFRGTLANLRESGFRGIIVCAEGCDSTWFGFQSTISAEEDTRDVLRARRLPFLYLQQPSEISKSVHEIAAHLHSGDGPFVLLATQDVLEATGPIEVPTGPLTPPSFGRCPINTDALNDVADAFNDDGRNIIIQAGQLTMRERELLYSVAKASGAALADSLTHPGSVTEYVDGERFPNYLGTLGLYGFNTALYRFTHANGKLRQKADLTYIFLNSKIGEVSTPFSEGALRRRSHVVQVAQKKAHISPAADISLVGTPEDFLKGLLPLLKVDQSTRERRRAHIAQCSSRSPAIGELLPSKPMTTNFFFARLRETVASLIENESYTYTGVYDVGRCGVSAIRNIPRTDPGFSGWFGRAIMGDAYQATPSISLSRGRNVVAFIGDGAASIGPNITPSIAEHVDRQGKRPEANTTVFIFENGGHSIINSYQEGRIGAYGGRQMRVLNFPTDTGIVRAGGLTVRTTTLHEYDEPTILAALRDPDFFDVIHVRLAHTNGGDGISLIDETSWQREELSPLGVSAARMRRNS
ncbi:biosynthesis protein PigD [Auritidibacter ignavus]|uniref:biosynthesis protein PigD n=1 Tax=Auritidibacter ignavus TaxID=678932 RepID=UPI00109C0695|nr:biosynthesis protein PigD [Auritidibacter ignavus]